MMSNVQWFYAGAQQQQQGPVAFEQIQQLAASGQIQPSTLIWNEGMPSWTAASQVQGVFNAGVPPVAAAAPQANPYAAPNTGYPMAAAPTGGSYPIPPVKKCSFGLLMTFSVIGIVAYIIGFVVLITDTTNTAQSYEPLQAIETQSDFDQLSESDLTISDGETPSLFGVGIIGVGAILLIVAWIIALVHLHRAWFILQSGRPRTSPGKAVGFMFIPFFNIYWIFVCYHGWSQDWNRIKSSHSNLAQMPSVSEGLFLAGPICTIASIVPIVGLVVAVAYPILFLIMHAKICSVVNAMAAASQPR